MKKNIISLVVVIGITITSCKKNYNCICYDAYGNTISSTIIPSTSLTDAQTICYKKGTSCSI